jgi:hypothetical protein
LSELKHQTGDLAAPPELIIQSMLKEGQLPEHDWCVICETDTDNVCWLKVICESISMQKKERLGCLSMMIMVLSPWELVLHLLGGGDEVQEVGRSVRFNLPIRLCDVCGKDQGKLTLKQVMSLVPIYAYLLGKYPHAEVSPSRG